MRLYTSTDGYALVVDLDDLSIYPQEWLEMGVCDLFSKCMEEAGTSIYYMDYLHPGWGDCGQRDRVGALCDELSKIWNYMRKFQADAYRCTLLNEDEYRLALMSWLWRFEDETENQC